MKPQAAKAVALLLPKDALVCIIFHVRGVTLCAPVISTNESLPGELESLGWKRLGLQILHNEAAILPGGGRGGAEPSVLQRFESSRVSEVDSVDL